MAQFQANTPFGIVKDAYFDAGYLEEGEDPDSEKLATGLRKLGDLISLWQTQGLKLWLLQDLTIPLVAGQGSYSLSPTGDVLMVKPLRVLQAYHQDTSNVRRPLVPLAYEEWLRLSIITGNTGEINSYFVDKQATELLVHFWPSPDTVSAAGTGHVLITRQVTVPVTLTESMMFPQEWRIALRWGLADELATGQPQAIMDRCQQRAEIYRTALEDWDVEDTSVRFVLDSRMTYNTGRFQ